MAALAEKQVKSALSQRRVLTRAIAPWSRAPAPERSVLRAIVGVSRAQSKPDSAPASAEPALQRACAECGDELTLQRLELESGEDELEQQVQREGEPPTFADAGDDEEARLGRGPGQRPDAAITVGPADDEYEREADAVADRVTGADAASAGPKPAEDDERAKALRGKRGGVGREGGEVDDPGLAARLHTPAGGRPLSAALRAVVEPQLPYDFSAVRVHDDAGDRADAASLNARAFTYGKHIWVGPGESADNPRLMAHELTHVVQQGGVRRFVQRDDADGASEPGFIARMALDLVRRYAPRLEPVLRRGPLNWLKDQLMSAFDGVVGTLNRLNPRAALEQLAAMFQGLMDRAAPVITALRAGNCEPLFQAIADMKNFVTEVAGAAWDKLVDFLRPIGDFFTNIWNGFGAPAVEWLQAFAGDVWNGIREFGAYIWDSTAGIRSAIGGAWSWVKEQLFGPEDPSTGESQGGIVAWIQNKAMAAWEEVKALTRPVWQPVVEAAQKIRELIPPPFIRRLGEQFRDLSASLNRVNEEASAGDDVAENRDALAAALPTVQEVITGVRGIIVSSGAWLQEKIGAFAGDAAALLARLNGNALLRPLGTLLGWLDGAAQSLAAWAREKVSGLFNLVLQAFDFLSPFVQRLVTTVRNVITVVGDLLQLPSLILNAVWNLIPACIRNPIRDFLVNQILARIPVFSTLLALPDIWARIEATALRILRQVFVDGNLGRAAWTFFSSILEVLGLPPQLVVSVLAKAASAIGDILSDPVGFLLNLLSAIKEGFIRFFDNIGTHLLGGVTGWLFGHLTRAGLQPPQDFTLRSVLGFVLQVLDITMDRVFERLARKIDPAIVQRLRQALAIATGVWRFVVILVDEGPAGLWREIQEQLSGLWNRVLDAVIGWVTRTIIGRVTARLLTMLDPTGVMAVVNSLIALYRAIQSAIEYLREMLMIVDRVLDGINGIARGAIDIAAGFFETALASGLPVAIGFLANQIGLRDVGERIQEMVEGVREMVDRAIDWLIDRAIAGGQALINMLRRGVAAVRNWWAVRKRFTSEEGGEGHDLYFEGSGTSARLMIRSDPQNYREFVNGVTVPPAQAAKVAAKAEALEIAGELDQAVARAGSGAAPAPGSAPAPAAAGPTAVDPSAEIDGLLDRLATATARFMPRTGGSTPAVYGPLVSGFGSSVRVERLAAPCPGGSEPTGAAGGDAWDALRRRQFGGGSYYVRGHLLNNNLGGPGDTWANLTPLTQAANNRGKESMLHQFESPVKTKVLEQSRIVHFQVTAHYGRVHPLANQVPTLLGADRHEDDPIIAAIIRAEQNIPQTIACEADVLAGNGQAAERVAPPPIQNTIDDQDIAHYQLTPTPKVDFYVDGKSKDELQHLDGVTEAIAKDVVKNRPSGGYRRGAQLVQQGVDWERAKRTPGLRVRIYERN